jgi:hypothetical protein
MDKITICLTAADRRALLMFLKRSSLRPPEISTFAAIYRLIESAQPLATEAGEQAAQTINLQSHISN